MLVMTKFLMSLRRTYVQYVAANCPTFNKARKQLFMGQSFHGPENTNNFKSWRLRNDIIFMLWYEIVLYKVDGC